jgi:hypothetical protein
MKLLEILNRGKVALGINTGTPATAVRSSDDNYEPGTVTTGTKTPDKAAPKQAEGPLRSRGPLGIGPSHEFVRTKPKPNKPGSEYPIVTTGEYYREHGRFEFTAGELSELWELNDQQNVAWRGILDNDYESNRKEWLRLTAEGIKRASECSPEKVPALNRDTFYDRISKMRQFKLGFGDLSRRAAQIIHPHLSIEADHAKALAAVLESEERAVHEAGPAKLGLEFRPSLLLIAHWQAGWNAQQICSPKSLGGEFVEAVLNRIGIERK